MKTVFFLCLATSVLSGNASAQSTPQAPQPPTAPRQDHVVEWHGERVQDPWFWLREKDSRPVLDYLKAENAYTLALTASLAPFSIDVAIHGSVETGALTTIATVSQSSPQPPSASATSSAISVIRRIGPA